MISRHLEPIFLKALKNTPVLYINGPRQVGKSTLCRLLANDYEYKSLDTIRTQLDVYNDPVGFIHHLKPKTIIDEIQLAPALFRLIKSVVDERRFESLGHPEEVAGHFILTGSTTLMSVPELADALVGRMHTLTLLPLSAAEALDGNLECIPALFERTPLKGTVIFKKHDLASVIAQSSYPEIALSKTLDPTLWYDNYINTVIKRDIRSMADIEKFEQLPLMFNLLAHRVGNLLCHASLSREAGIPTSTYKKHLAFFHHVFLINLVPPWYRNISKRLTKSPKVFMVDTALLTHMITIKDLHSHPMRGPILENFVASELQKHLLIHTQYKLFHFRTLDDKEVDFVIERQDGKLIALEVKYSMTPSLNDFKGLKALQELVGDDFQCGVVLYQGTEILHFGPKLYALPLQCLWESFVSKDA